jgi:hypothetical protein
MNKPLLLLLLLLLHLHDESIGTPQSVW